MTIARDAGPLARSAPATPSGSAPVVPPNRWSGRRAGGALRSRLRHSSTGRLELAAVGLLVVLTVVLLVAPVLLPHGELDLVGTPFSRPFGAHFLGTDTQGRDVFSRTVIGMRTSWFAALGVIAIGVGIGGFVGLVAGLTGRWIDALLMRVTDAALALPAPLVALAVVSALGPGLEHTLIAVGATWWPWYARIVRGQVQSIVRRPHVEAARLGGLSRTRVALLHVLPGALGSVAVAASLDVGAVILVLSGLSFLGLGSPAPAAELGGMTADGLTYLLNAPWVALVPAAALFILALLANFAGDGVRDLVGG